MWPSKPSSLPSCGSGRGVSISGFVAVRAGQQRAQPQQGQLVQHESRVNGHRGQSLDRGPGFREIGCSAAAQQQLHQHRDGRPPRRHVARFVEEVDGRPRQLDGAGRDPRSAPSPWRSRCRPSGPPSSGNRGAETHRDIRSAAADPRSGRLHLRVDEHHPTSQASRIDGEVVAARSALPAPPRSRRMRSHQAAVRRCPTRRRTSTRCPATCERQVNGFRDRRSAVEVVTPPGHAQREAASTPQPKAIATGEPKITMSPAILARRARWRAGPCASPR